MLSAAVFFFLFYFFTTHYHHQVIHCVWNSCILTNQLFFSIAQTLALLSLFTKMLMPHCSTIMLWLGSWLLVASQQLSPGCSRCQRQLAHTCMRTHRGMNTCALRRRLTPLVYLAAMFTLNSAYLQNLNIALWYVVLVIYRKRVL